MQSGYLCMMERPCYTCHRPLMINLCDTDKDTTHHSHLLLTLHIPLDISGSYHSELEQSVLQPDLIAGPSCAMCLIKTGFVSDLLCVP